MNEVSRYKKIPAYTTLEIEFEEDSEEYQIEMTDIDPDIYQIDIIRDVESIVIGKQIIFSEEGTAKIFYFKYPEQIDADTDEDYEFELDTDALECMVYGVAADLLKADVASQFGRIYAERYEQLLQRLDSRSAMGAVYIDGGVEI